MKLNGPIYAVGDSNVDAKRLENLKELTQLVDALLFDIAELAPFANRPEASIKAIGNYAKAFIEEVQAADDF